jgi:hypothetical protein
LLWPLAQPLCYRFDAGSYRVALIGGMAIAGREKRGGSVRQTFLGISQVTNGASLGDAVKRLRAPHWKVTAFVDAGRCHSAKGASSAPHKHLR